jgi:hypothetical protein
LEAPLILEYIDRQTLEVALADRSGGRLHL